MILVTGGLGFIGQHTVRALLDLGESCLLVQRREPVLPPLLAGAGPGVQAERLDLGDRAALLALGERHPITGIVHLAGSVPWPPGAAEPFPAARAALDGLLNVLAAAHAWGVARVGVASTIGVYLGAERAAGPDGALAEDLPLPMTAPHPIPAFKKIAELVGDHFARTVELPVVQYRIGAVWGPGGRPASPFFATPALVHAAARGGAPDAAGWHAGDGLDMMYVRDCGRAIALLQTAPRLGHGTYNVSSGRVTTHGEIAAAIRAVLPDALVELPPGRRPQAPPRDTCLDISRLRRDTGYEPAYPTAAAVADYLAWLRAGNER